MVGVGDKRANQLSVVGLVLPFCSEVTQRLKGRSLIYTFCRITKSNKRGWFC